MKIYKVRADLSYQSIVTDEAGSLKALADRVGEPIGNFSFPSFYVSTPKDKRGNFFNASYGLLVFDDMALDLLGGLVEKAGEQFKAEVEDVALLNVLNVLEACPGALDHEASKWMSENRKTGLRSYAFKANEINSESGLFRIPEDRYSGIFAVSDSASRGESFYDVYQSAGLTGLSFRLSWTDES